MSRVIAGQYELLERIGQGGMGAVWRARDMRLDREVAVKEVVLPQGLEEAERARLHARVEREAKAAARLDHPGIVTVHTVVEEDGRPWIVMRLVRGRSLEKVLREEGPLPPHRAAAIGGQLARALRAAHAAGVVHRDVKPANVLLEEDRAVLTDFGIAVVAGEETLTRTGGLIGSPAYLSPEQARGLRVGPPTDLWSLGATLYAAVEGRPPFRRPDVWSLIGAIGSDAPHDPPVHAGPLRPVLEGLLRKDPEHRMTAEEAERLLEAIARQEPVTPPAAWTPPGTGGGDVGVGAPAHPPGPPHVVVPGPTVPVQTGASAPAPVPRHRSSALLWTRLAAAVAIIVAVASAAVFVAVALTDGPGPGPSPTPEPSPTATADARTTAVVPAGYVRHDGGSFTALVPRDWRREQDGRDWSFLDMTEGRRRGISVMPLGHGVGTVAQHLNAAAEGLKNKYRDYRQIAFREGIDYLGERAAEVEFTFTENGTAGHARVRVFRFNGEFYMITMIAFQSVWAESVPHFETFLNSFQAS
ncbi:serine/threonine-protein kinase [Thermomonospora catenispora]|mgnify:CR=1 FL=1|uniref:serine/threonine-protein kinase n=1 Tax=Thermomonospora catenispora TaxID=2493090 RepID=UPI0011200E5D|nr:serine/threonine-protein kinase [Thermomonospora catenispora]TNY38451.1 serine/threonine protein kinase [Thermomonospora catenispora]